MEENKKEEKIKNSEENKGNEEVKPQIKKKKKISKKVKLIVAVVIITVAIVVVFYSLHPKPYLTVGDVVGNLDYYKDKNIEVKGTVKDVSNNTTGVILVFNLTDGKNTLKVEYNNAVPQGFLIGKEVAVSGKLVNKNNEWVFEANNIQVGCPSKYE